MRFTVDLQAESKRSPALAQSARQPLVDRLRPNRRPSTECNDGFTESRSLKGHRLRKQRMLRGAGPLPRCDLLSLLGVLPSACFFTASLCCLPRSSLHFLLPFRRADAREGAGRVAEGGSGRVAAAAAYIHRFYLLFRRIDTENPSECGVHSGQSTDESLPSACGLPVDDSHQSRVQPSCRASAAIRRRYSAPSVLSIGIIDL